MNLFALAIALMLLASCANHSGYEDGPDTTRKVDENGNPNFGPR